MNREPHLPWEALHLFCDLLGGLPGALAGGGWNSFSSILASFTYWQDFPSRTMLFKTFRETNLEPGDTATRCGGPSLHTGASRPQLGRGGGEEGRAGHPVPHGQLLVHTRVSGGFFTPGKQF